MSLVLTVTAIMKDIRINMETISDIVQRPTTMLAVEGQNKQKIADKKLGRSSMIYIMPYANV